jgi:predicted alpha/beta hydrolase
MRRSRTVGLEAIGHFGAFRHAASRLWDDVIAWIG